MKIVITAIIAVALGVALIVFLRKATDKQKTWTLRIISLVLGAVFFFRMVKSPDVFDSVVKLNTSAVRKLGDMTSGEGLWFSILRWITMYSVLFCLLAPWFKIQAVDNMVSLFTPIIIILNLVFLNLTFIGFLGVDGFSWEDSNSVLRTVEFILELAIMGGMSIYYLYEKIAKKDWAKMWKQGLYMLMIVAIYALIVIPEPTPVNIFGYSGYVMDTFELGHRLMLYAMLVVMAIAYALLRKKEYQIRHFVLLSFSLGLMISFFYPYTLKIRVTSLPLHLCNAGMILMFFSFALRNKPIYYFNFLVNVLGSLIALISCNTSADFISVSGIHFYWTHLWLFILPCMAMALQIFGRPNFKMVRGAVLVFTIYYLIICVANPWFNNYAHGANYIETGDNPGIDYFYIMSDFLPDMFPFAKTLKDNYAYSFMVGDLTMWVFPVLWVLVYVVYVAAIFGTWFVYDLLFKVGDRHYDMLLRKRRIKADLLGIENARKINLETSEPLNKEGTNMIKFSHFTKRYGNSKVKAVDDFNLEIYDGEVFGFIGHNGAGKSTCIKSLVGIQSITEGNIEICGFDIAKQPLPAKKLMGYVPDNHAVYERLTGREYINYVADLYRVSKEDREERLEKYLDLFKLKGDIDRQIKGYSHGMKQKIVVIAALIHEPKVWVLDEPLTGLDPTSSYQIKECMREHANKGNIVFFSSHVIEVVEKICNRIAIISKGKLQCVHAIDDLKAKGMSLEELYMQYVQVVDEEMLHSEDKLSPPSNATQTQIVDEITLQSNTMADNTAATTTDGKEPEAPAQTKPKRKKSTKTEE